jgi:hypothetical protein
MYDGVIRQLDSRYLCLVTRPLAATIASGIGGGVFGAWGGLVYGALEGSLSFVAEGTMRGAFAGAVAGFIAGLVSGLDRMHWPEAPREERVAQTVRVAPVAVTAPPRSPRSVVGVAS